MESYRIIKYYPEAEIVIDEDYEYSLLDAGKADKSLEDSVDGTCEWDLVCGVCKKSYDVADSLVGRMNGLIECWDATREKWGEGGIYTNDNRKDFIKLVNNPLIRKWCETHNFYGYLEGLKKIVEGADWYRISDNIIAFNDGEGGWCKIYDCGISEYNCYDSMLECDCEELECRSCGKETNEYSEEARCKKCELILELAGV